MVVDPRTVIGRSKVTRRIVKVGATLTKLAGLNPDRLVLRFAVANAVTLLISPHTDLQNDLHGESVTLGSAADYTNGSHGPLTQIEWWGIGSGGVADVHVLEVSYTCDGGGGPVESVTGAAT